MYNLYSIHADIGSDDAFTKVVPCIYALLPDKTQATYEELFQAIKENIPNFRPDFIKSDYETAAMNALRAIYPSAALTGCFFHYCQAIYKNGEKWDLTDTREGCAYLAKCVALAHLPNTKIHEGWLSVLVKSPNMPNISKFNDYMSRQWIRIEMIDVLSCFGHRHRTNNVTKSWHKKINGRMHKNYNLFHFVSQLKAEANIVDFIVLQNEMGRNVYQKRNKKYTDRDTKIQKILNNFLIGMTSIDICIQQLSYLKY